MTRGHKAASQRSRRGPQVAPPLVISVDSISLHPVLMAAGIVGGDYALNDISVLPADAVMAALHAHPVLVTKAPQRRKPSANPTKTSPGGSERQTTGAPGSAGDASFTEAASEAAAAATPRLRLDSPGVDSRDDGASQLDNFFAVGGLRAWSVAAALTAREPPTKPLFVTAVMMPREEDAVVLTRARTEQLLEVMLFSLKPHSAARQIAMFWSNLREHDATGFSRLYPGLTSQNGLMRAMGYTSRFAFRPAAVDALVAAAAAEESPGSLD